MQQFIYSRTVTVLHSDTDMLGFATVPAFISWMEETEYEFLRTLGLSVSMTDRRGRYGFPRLIAEVDIHYPAWPGDNLEIGLGIGQTSGKVIEYRFRVERMQSGKARKVATGRFEVACCRFPREGLPYAILIPDLVLERLDRGLGE